MLFEDGGSGSGSGSAVELSRRGMKQGSDAYTRHDYLLSNHH